MFERAKNFSLRRVFMGVALAVMASCVSTPLNYHEDGLSYQSINQASTEIAWKDLNTNWSFEYDDEGPNWTVPDGEHTLSVQLESSVNELEGLTLSDFEDPQSILTRHGEAAAYILDKYADEYSGVDIDVRLLEPTEELVNTFFKITNPSTHALMENVDVLGLSMVFISPSINISAGNITAQSDIESADKLWTGSDMILVWSAGNEGRKTAAEYPRPGAFHTMRADAMVRIGEVVTGTDDVVRIADHSNRGGISFLVQNPYTDPDLDDSFQYVRNEDQLRERMDKLYAVIFNDKGITGTQVFHDQLVVREHYPIMRPMLLEANPLMLDDNVNFEGKDIILNKTPTWQRNNPEIVRQAFMNALVSAIDFENNNLGADKSGQVKDITGTSFAQPYANAMITAAHEIYPEFSEFEIIAAALIAAEPVLEVEANKRSILSLATGGEGITYSNNGRNLHYNDKAGGFGLVKKEAYFDVLEQMSEMKNQNPSLSTEHSYISSGPQSPDKLLVAVQGEGATAVKEHSYDVEVREDVLTMRTNLSLSFKGDHNKVPPTITLVNPAGKEVTIAPTNVKKAQAKYSLATTDGHFGNHAKGTWKIKIKGDYELEAVQLDIHGSHIGGLIDQYLSEHIDTQPVPETVGKDGPIAPSIFFDRTFDLLSSDLFEPNLDNLLNFGNGTSPDTFDPLFNLELFLDQIPEEEDKVPEEPEDIIEEKESVFISKADNPKGPKFG